MKTRVPRVVAIPIWGRPTIVTWLVLALALAVALALLPPRLAFAHGDEATVTVEPAQASHGDTITVTGSEFAADLTVTVSLEGVRGTVVLGELQTDASGSFSGEFTIPEEASPGTYRLRVTGADEAVAVDFSVLEEGGSPAAAASAGGGEIVFQRSAGEIVAIAIVAVVLALAGTVLVLAGTEPGRAILRRD